MAWRAKHSLFELSAASHPGIRERRESDADEQLVRLESFIEIDSVFDVAAAGGFFLNVAQRRGWNIDGNDISGAAVKFAERNVSIKLRLGYLEDVVPAEKRFNAINMWNSLEHLHDPQGALRICHRMLGSGGVLMVKLPNKGRNLVSEHYDEAHLFEWDAGTSRRFIESSGFEQIWSRHDAAESGSYTAVESFFKKI